MSQNDHYLQATSESWLALSIGNSRLHWAWFLDDVLQDTWHLPHGFGPTLSEQAIALRAPKGIALDWSQFPQALVRELSPEPEHWPELWISSVVPAQTDLWRCYPRVHVLTLPEIPLENMYPTLGLDRALAVWGAGKFWGWPVLVIDCGTALTLSGADAHHGFIGGAILPGLGLQLRSLGQSTAALPLLSPSEQLPPRWARTTLDAIYSGTLYTTLAGVREFIDDWWQQYPDGWIVFTGGDRPIISAGLTTWLAQQRHLPPWHQRLVSAPTLLFQAIQALRQNQKLTSSG